MTQILTKVFWNLKRKKNKLIYGMAIFSSEKTTVNSLNKSQIAVLSKID